MNSITMTTITANLSEILVYGAIAVITLIGAIKCIYPVARNARLLNRAILKLEKSTAQGEKPVWRDQRFLGRSLRNEWQQFLLNAGQLDLRGIPCNTEDYINEDSVIIKPGHAQLADLIPGLLTSLGILGTFLGLMQGLTSINFSNAEGTIQSIPEMLGGMKFAFATSVAGISCSLAFNVLNRIATGHALRAIDNFEECFYELAMPRPLQPEVQLLCQKQDQDAMMNRMAEQIAGRMSATLENSLNGIMMSLHRFSENGSQSLSREQIEGVQRITNQFIQQLNLILSGEITSLSTAMRDAADLQRKTTSAFSDTLRETRNLIESTQKLTSQNAEMIMQLQNICIQMEQLQRQNISERNGQVRS